MSEIATVKTVSHSIKGVYSYHPTKFEDARGINFEIYQQNDYPVFKLDSCSMSKKRVLRGFHGDMKNWKLIQCLSGKIKFVLIDMREDSGTFLKVKMWYLDSKNPTQILVPPGVVNAHLCLSDECTFFYKWSEGYVPIDQQIHVKWNDPKHNIPWGIKNPILSDRDK
jgi:dTDP-4-dehydrorhamnose 3,5-epimerase